MTNSIFPNQPKYDSYDVVIIGGAMIGSSVAWFLTQEADFDGRILVLERDPSYSACSTAHTNSCIRQQFGSELNIRLSQFTADYIKTFRARMGGDTRIPDLNIQNFGYIYMAATDTAAAVLRQNHALQTSLGAVHWASAVVAASVRMDRHGGDHWAVEIPAVVQ